MGINDALVGHKIALSGVVPHSLTDQMIKIHTGKLINHFEKDVEGDSFHIVTRDTTERIPLQVNINRTKVSENLLLRETSTPLNILNRASRLAIIGTLGYDLSKKTFYLNAEYLGVDLKEILQYASS